MSDEVWFMALVCAIRVFTGMVLIRRSINKIKCESFSLDFSYRRKFYEIEFDRFCVQTSCIYDETTN